MASAFLNHGQLCFSTERVIVLESVAKEFQEHLKTAATGFDTGSGVSDRILESSLEKLRDAESKGAKFVIGGPERISPSALKPTILTGVTKEMTIFDDEAFSPSFSLYIAKDDKEAIEMANRTRYGLNAAVHSRDMQHALEVAQQLDTAQIHVNSLTAQDERKFRVDLKAIRIRLTAAATFPIGGVKGSGWGRNNAEWGLREFCEIKLVTLSPAENDVV